MLTNAIWRSDRHGNRSLVTSDETKAALAVLNAAIDRAAAEERASLKARQDAGEMNINERMLRSIFGDIE